jgi:DNA-binding winged helix-turn-helix (wHTH) protein/TolB-like protein/tetratricopeptide (TPR) repeat protein
MSLTDFDFYDFGRFRLDVREKLLRRDGVEIALTPRLYDLLLVLVTNAGRTLEKSDLLARVWGSTFVEEGSLARGISRLRAALDTAPGDEGLVQTVARRGYRFVADVRPGRHEPVTSPAGQASPGGEADPDPEADTVPPRTEAPPTDASQPPDPEGSSAAAMARSRRRSRRGWVAAAGSAALIVTMVAVWRWPSPPATVHSIAILPLRTFPASTDGASLGLGLADALITRLARARDLTVRPTSAILRYEHGSIEAPIAAQALGVDAALEGTVRESADRVRVSVQLLDRHGRHLWVGQFDERRADLFALESSIAARVADALELTLRPVHVGAADARPVKPEAHDAYLRGRSLIVRLTEDTLRRGIAYLTRAVELDPSYAQAYAGLAFAHINTVDLIASPAEAFPRARAAAERARALDDSLADAHAMLGTVAMQFDWDWGAAERQFRRSVALDPNLAFGHVYYGWLLALTGRFDESREQIAIARRLDPLSLDVATTSSLIPYYERDVRLAQLRMRETIELYPDVWLAHALLGRALELGGDLPGAIASFERASQLDGGVPEVLMDLGRAYGRAGRRQEALAVLSRLDDLARRRHVAPFQRAMIHVGLGDREQAFHFLHQAADQRSWYMSWLKVDPMLDPLRSDPRYAALLRRVGLSGADAGKP